MAKPRLSSIYALAAGREQRKETATQQASRQEQYQSTSERLHAAFRLNSQEDVET